MSSSADCIALVARAMAARCWLLSLGWSSHCDSDNDNDDSIGSGDNGGAGDSGDCSASVVQLTAAGGDIMN
jgi:hypothetical protein